MSDLLTGRWGCLHLITSVKCKAVLAAESVRIMLALMENCGRDADSLFCDAHCLALFSASHTNLSPHNIPLKRVLLFRHFTLGVTEAQRD